MKKPYQKPSIRRIKLVPSEAVLQACKTGGSSGPGASDCLSLNGPCASIGS